MKRVFFDTNVILDSILMRQGGIAANVALSAADFGDLEGRVSFLTVANTAYILKKNHTMREVVNLLQEAMGGLAILPMDSAQVLRAYHVDAPDFEDVLQYECAKAGECAVIVTSNTRHFSFSQDLRIVSTSDFARQFESRGPSNLNA